MDYAQRKEHQLIPKTLYIYIYIYIYINTCIYLFYYFHLTQILGLYKSYPLNENLVLEICRKGMQPVWFMNRKFCFKFFFILAS
jgi:hypothetical protein